MLGLLKSFGIWKKGTSEESKEKKGKPALMTHLSFLLVFSFCQSWILYCRGNLTSQRYHLTLHHRSKLVPFWWFLCWIYWRLCGTLTHYSRALARTLHFYTRAPNSRAASSEGPSLSVYVGWILCWQWRLKGSGWGFGWSSLQLHRYDEIGLRRYAAPEFGLS